MITIDQIREIALAMPRAEERPSYGGRPSWRSGPRMFTWVREDPEALVVWVDSIEEIDALIASHPDRFFTTSHYDGHPIVLVELSAIDIDEATEMIIESWRCRGPKRLVAQYDSEHSPER